MAANRNYSSTAGLMALQADISSGATTMTVDTTSGLPSQPFTLAVDYGTASEELVTVTGVSGLTLTIARGVDGTAAQAHTAGAVIRHATSARDFAEPAVHINATSATHGVTGALVGTSDLQSLDRKTFVSVSGSTVPLTVKAASGQSVNLIELKSNAGSTIGSVDEVGRVTLPGLLVTKPTNNFSTIVGRAGVGQTAPLMDLQDSSAVSVFSVSLLGAVTASGALTAASVAAQRGSYVSTADGTTTLYVRRTSTQTADLQQWQDNGAAAMAKVDKDGNGFFQNLPGRIASGSSVVSTDANGVASFSTGLSGGVLQRVVCWSGDSFGNANVVIQRYAPGAYATDGTVQIRARQADSGLSYGNHNLRVDWIALGSA